MVGTIAFDYYQMEKYLSEIGGYLAELHYIDQVFTYMAGVESSWWETATDGVLSAGTSAGHHIWVDFTGTVPFRRSWRVPQLRLPWQDSMEDEAWQRIKAYQASAPGWASSNMDSVRAMIAPLAHPAESVYDGRLIQPVQETLARLEDSVSHDFGKLRHSLGHWSGEAADDFAANFYEPFQHTLASHQRMLAALAAGLEGARAIVVLTQQSLMNVLHEIRDALLEQLHRRAQQAAAEADKSIKNALVIATGVIPLFKAQSLWDTGLDLTGVGASALAAAATSESMTSYTLTGATADELLIALSKAIGVIEDNSTEQYRTLDREVRAALSRMEFIRDAPDGQDGRLVPRQPRLAHGADSSDFYLPEAR